MRITKKQVAVITLLNLIIAALIGAVFMLARDRKSGQADGKPDLGATDPNGNTVVTTPPHNKLRAASNGLVKEISRETRLMGSGDESVVFTHLMGGVTFVFGNAVVGDYDFDGCGGFVCRLDSAGKILGFTYLNGRLTAAGLIEGGFCAATVTDADSDDKSCALYTVDCDGTVTGEIGLDGEAIKILTVSSKRFAVVTALGKSTLKLTEYDLAGGTWSAGNNTRISDWLTVEFFDCYYMREQYTIAARVHNDNRYDGIVLYSFKAGGGAVPHYDGGADDGAITPYAVQPYTDGFMALCAYKGEAAIVTVDFTFTDFGRHMLGVECDGGSLVYSNGMYYASTSNNGAVTVFEINNDLTRANKGAFDAKLAHAVNMDETVFVGSSADKIIVTDGNAIKITLDIKNAAIARVFKTGYNTVLIVMSADGGAAVSKPTGERDVYIAEVII